jgi:hypothetical protein
MKAESVAKESGVKVEYQVGTMIELPRGSKVKAGKRVDPPGSGILPGNVPTALCGYSGT